LGGNGRPDRLGDRALFDRQFVGQAETMLLRHQCVRDTFKID
jgi:hypothetical protein